MRPKERALTALHLEEPDMVPLFEAWTTRSIIENVVGHKYQGVKDNVNFCRKLGMDCVVVSVGPPEALKPTYLKGNAYVDEFGRIFVAGESMEWYQGPSFPDMESYLDFEYPDPLAEGRLENVRFAIKEGEGYAVVGDIDWGIFERCWMPVGMDKFLTALYAQPSLARKIIERAYKFNLEIGKSLIDAGVDAVLSGDDLADNHGPLMSPQLFEEFFYYPLKRLVRSLKRRGVPFIMHTDGNIYPILDHLLDTGIDALHPIQPQVMDIGEFKKQFGDKICLIGNIDVSHLLPFGTPEDVARAVRSCIEVASAGGGHIVSSSNSLCNGIPSENILAMVRATRKYGIYPIGA